MKSSVFCIDKFAIRPIDFTPQELITFRLFNRPYDGQFFERGIKISHEVSGLVW